MRPGQNKRMRGNRPSNNRRGPNPLTRSYESNGPDVKIRGNAHHIAEKYLQLARDAHTGGDPVAAENYLQHAEHYFRLIAAAQAAQAHAQSGRPQVEGEAVELEDDDDFGGVSDRFASPAERAPQPFAPQPYAQGGQAGAPGVGPQPSFGDGEQQRPQQQGGGFQQPRQDRQMRQPQDRGPRQDRPFGDRQERGDFRENRGRDFRQRDFRPYRDPNAQRDNSSVPGPEGAAALPSFITAAPRVAGPMDVEQPAEPEVAAAEENGAIEAADNKPFDSSNEGRFPGRARRRRLRSPYGFHPSANQDEEGDAGPTTPDAPVSE